MTVNKGLVVGYFAQHQVEMLRDDQSPLWHLARISRRAARAARAGAAQLPRQLQLPRRHGDGTIEHFSGGEKARLALALIVWQRPNLLLLDEPTNHLDLETREALAVALAQFEGTLVLVSHDRHLLRATTEQLLIVADGAVGLRRRPGRLPRIAAQPAAEPPRRRSPRRRRQDPGFKKTLEARSDAWRS